MPHVRVEALTTEAVARNDQFHDFERPVTDLSADHVGCEPLYPGAQVVAVDRGWRNHSAG